MKITKNKKFVGMLIFLGVVFLGFYAADTAVFQGYLTRNILYVDQKSNQRISDIPKININTLNIKYGLCYDQKCETEKPDYVIITRPVFLDVLEGFIQWKQKNGFKVGVLTVDYIHNKNKKSNPAQSIREEIKKYTKDKATKYFVLIGDTSTSYLSSDDISSTRGFHPELAYDLTVPWNVPTGHYCSPVSYLSNDPLKKGKYDQCSIGTDLYYADFDDDNWKENADGFIMRGQYSNGYWYNGKNFVKYTSDLSPDNDDRVLNFETIVARIPIRKPEEFKNIFNKFKNLQTSNSFEYLSDSSLITLEKATKDYNMECNFPNISNDQIAEKVLNCSQNQILFKKLIEAKEKIFSFTSFPPQVDSDLIKVLDKFSNTKSVLFPLFHGGANEIALGDKSLIYSYENKSNAKSFFKNIFPIWISSSCNISIFGNSGPNEDVDSLSEAVFKAEKGPVLFVVPTNYYVFLKDILDGKTVGEAFYNKGQTVARYTSVSNPLFGDPSLKLVP